MFLSTIEELDLLPLIYEPTHRSGNTLDLILSSHTELLTVFFDNKLYSDHFPVFAFFTIPKLTLSTAGLNLSSQISKALFSCSVFNENISPCFDNLIFTQNLSFGSLSIEDNVRDWYSEIMAVINFACCKKTKRRQQLRYFYSSHTVHLLIKYRTASRLNNNNLRLSSLQYDIDQSIELDKTSLFESLSPTSTRDCFKYLRSFTRKRLPNQMHWKD